MKQKQEFYAESELRDAATRLEQERIRRCLDGHRPSQQALFEAYSSKMLGLCYRYTGGLQKAEELMQQGFVEAFSKIQLYRFQGHFQDWLSATMLSNIVRWAKADLAFEEYPEPVLAESYFEDIETDSGLHSSDIVEMIVSLPAAYRVVLNLYSIEGKHHEEIASLLRLEEHTIRNYYTRARMLMARLMAAKGRLHEIAIETVTILK